MTGPVLVVLLGIALVAYAQRPRQARRPGRRVCPAPRPRAHRPPVLAVLRLIFDLVLIPFQCVVVAFVPRHIRNRQTARRKNR